jgi:type IV pilus assembly protein PilY1
MLIKHICFAIGFAFIGASANSLADDTELYVLEASIRSQDNPQVLVILDTSGSMGDNDFTAPRFHAQGNIKNNTKIYYSYNAADVPLASSTQYFEYSKNGCASSKGFLADYGVYTGYFRQYNSSKWSLFPLTDGTGMTAIDCYEDIAENNNSNASSYSNGFPVDGLTSPYDTDIEKAKLTELGLGKPIYIYTKDYIDWYHDTSKPNGVSNRLSYTRMDVAKRVIEEMIVNTPGVDFGLAIFNKNSDNSKNGGRIISGIKAGTIANKNSLIDKVKDSISINGNYTPLCETLFEAYSYLYGKNIKFSRQTGGSTGNPTFDTSIENNNNTKYISPFVDKKCQSKASIIYVTDGIPNNDVAADSDIGLLPGIKVTDGIDVVWNRRTTTNLLPALAGWMYRNDVNPNISGDQTVTTYTIGFSEGATEAKPLLEKTALLGGGKFYEANSAAALQVSLLSALAAIQEDSASFSSPSVVLDKTQTGNAAYFAMFLPTTGPRWSGNIKKFKVEADGSIVDRNGASALDDTGAISKTACSLWTDPTVCSATTYNAADASVGGVAAKLRSTYNSSVSTRKVLTNIGSTGALVPLSKSNIQLNSAVNTDTKLATLMGVTDGNIESTLDWAKGVNIDQEKIDPNDTTAPYIRHDIMGDPLHSRPLVINFGTVLSPNNRVIVGTNHGYLHMFKDIESADGKSDSVVESWAFLPTELLKNIKGLRDNPKTGVHSIYGFDGTPVPYIERNSSGLITKAWLFFGMRRGGSSYYALDISAPDAPILKWISQSADFPLMGQSWSKPVVTKVPGWPSGAVTANSAKPVLIVGAGYNPTTKDGPGVGAIDSGVGSGAGLYIIDADTGVRVHSFGASGTNTVMSGLADSIPNSVAVLDSNSDQLTDRIYATDTGANVWRIDMPSLPTSSSSPWSAFKFASLGSKGSTETDIRFFSEPVIAQTAFSNVQAYTHTTGAQTGTTTYEYQNVPYDAVTIGSGHRPHPLDKVRKDRFFVLQDRNIVSKSFSSAAGNTAPTTLQLSNLYDVTTSSPVTDTENLAFGEKRGWYYNFKSVGEKSLSASTIANGKVFFTSYVPETGATANACIVPGQGRLYPYDLHKGTRTYVHTEDYFETGEQVPDTPTLVIPNNGTNESYMYLIGIGDAANDMIKKDEYKNDGCAAGDEKCIGGGLGVNRIYYHVNENQ